MEAWNMRGAFEMNRVAPLVANGLLNRRKDVWLSKPKRRKHPASLDILLENAPNHHQ
jgi:hypothetical protein